MSVLRIGVAGLGRGFTVMLPTLRQDPRVRLVAAADPRPEARQRFTEEFGGPTYETVAQLCADPDVEIVYVATPHQFHAEHVGLATAARRHVLVEKPLAISLAECGDMIAAAEAARVHLVVGHSHSFNAPYGRAREIVASGALGRLGMITAMNFTDFLYRPRRPEELVTAQGGGVVFSQGAHQIDIIRLIGGGRVHSVRAATGSWDPARPTEGAYAALLTFDEGHFASAVYNGYGHFDTDVFCDGIGELGLPKDRSRYGASRRALSSLSADDEARLKAERNYGGAAYQPAAQVRLAHHQHFGVLVASCAHGDLRPVPDGLMIYDDREQRHEIILVPQVARAEVIDELYDAVVHGKPPLHGAAWAMATLEVCLAILQSAQEQRDVRLTHQVALA